MRVVILRGQDADFSAGNDMQDFMKFIQTPLQAKAGDTPPFAVEVRCKIFQAFNCCRSWCGDWDRGNDSAAC